jgi:hypothetical protein
MRILSFKTYNLSLLLKKNVMTKLDELKKHLKPGKVYRRSDLAKWSKSVDRHLGVLVDEGTLQKLSQGLYYYPQESAFGRTPPEEEALIKSFLKDDRFLLTSINAYNSLGLGTTQLYNQRMVYNHKRHGDFKLGNKKFSFRVKPHFPKKATPEFLLVDLVNNWETLAEDPKELLKNISRKVCSMDSKKLERSVQEYGNARAKRIFAPLMSA